MAIRDQALILLRGQAASRVRFSFSATTGRTVTVGGSTYRRVATAIEAGRITLVENPHLPDGSASYDSGPPNVFNVPPLVHREQRGFFIHEATHASFDLTYTNGLPVIDEEAACYIAEALYYRRAGLGRARRQHAAWTDAMAIADSLVRHRAAADVDTTALHRLRSAIRNHPSYFHRGVSGCYTSNG